MVSVWEIQTLSQQVEGPPTRVILWVILLWILSGMHFEFCVYILTNWGILPSNQGFETDDVNTGPNLVDLSFQIIDGAIYFGWLIDNVLDVYH